MADVSFETLGLDGNQRSIVYRGLEMKIYFGDEKFEIFLSNAIVTEIEELVLSSFSIYI
ncbi:hypothetical protein IW492_14170 [Enterococcus sp. BWB1-3]|uniref:hypothetical protein n=1 Tax=Enterococcus sp. BWB1-3 TaxID=2787713 RepID=UPI0019227630|nr:hypothetical protein [Enterococcus sp. BWB1-3]MBL1230378.1 hypothetical protein [Enterococcus sp. BWB1-3]